MAVRGVDHVNIGTDRLEETIAFFRNAIGLEVGWRPPFSFGGAWLYAGECAVVHLVDLPRGRRSSDEAALDHFAFSIDDYESALERLDRLGIAHRQIEVPGAPVRQIFVRDPNGVNIELNCRVAAEEPAPAAS